MAVDTHAHMFKRGLKLADVRRYAPDYDATLTDYLATLDASGLTHGVLVQPSFLGTDNSFMIDGLQAARDRLRGIVMIDPAATKEELVALDRAGVVGLRLNLVGLPIPPCDAEPWPALFSKPSRISDGRSRCIAKRATWRASSGHFCGVARSWSWTTSAGRTQSSASTIQGSVTSSSAGRAAPNVG